MRNNKLSSSDFSIRFGKNEQAQLVKILSAIMEKRSFSSNLIVVCR